jgi:hypothetical protein
MVFGLKKKRLIALTALGLMPSTPRRVSRWDDDARYLFQVLFFRWVTSGEHNWVILGERRGAYVESTVNQLINWQMCKKKQARSKKARAHNAKYRAFRSIEPGSQARSSPALQPAGRSRPRTPRQS